MTDPQDVRDGDNNRPVWRRLLVPGVFAVFGLAILLRLGFWQVDRLAWKEDLIRQVEQSLTLPASPAPAPSDWPATTAPGADYRKVEIRGRFLPGEVYYYNALTSPKGPYGGPGYFVHAPLQTAEGWVVMVNRGFVPDLYLDPAKRPGSAAPEGEMTVSGILRQGEAPNALTPAPDLSKRIWFARDPQAMAKGLEVSAAVAPYVIDADAALTPPSGLPQAGETVVRFKNDHLGYALTWFGLAATLAGVYAAYAVSVLRSRASKKPGA
ncbi:MAG: SURF1 family protein [Pannonibacter sp.]